METEDRWGWYTFTTIIGAIILCLIGSAAVNVVDKYTTKVFLPSFNK